MSNNEAISESDETMPVMQVGNLFEMEKLKCFDYETNKKEMIRDILETPAPSGQNDLTGESFI